MPRSKNEKAKALRNKLEKMAADNFNAIIEIISENICHDAVDKKIEDFVKGCEKYCDLIRSQEAELFGITMTREDVRKIRDEVDGSCLTEKARSGIIKACNEVLNG